MTMPDYNNDAAQMRVMFQKARNMLVAFYTKLDHVRQQIGDERQFFNWCMSELNMGPGFLDNTAQILSESDRLRVRDELRATRQAEREARTMAAEERRQAQQERRNQVTVRTDELQRLRETSQHQEEELVRLRELERLREERRERARRNRVNRDNSRRNELQASPPEDRVVAQLLAECHEIDDNNEINLGRRYRAIKVRIENGSYNGLNDTGHRFKWSGWCTLYKDQLKRSRKEIERLISLAEHSPPVMTIVAV